MIWVILYFMTGFIVHILGYSFISVKCIRVAANRLHRSNGKPMGQARRLRFISEVILWPGMFVIMLHEIWHGVRLWRSAGKMLRDSRRRSKKLLKPFRPGMCALIDDGEQDLREAFYRALHSIYTQ